MFKKRPIYSFLALVALLTVLIVGCTNPVAPAFDATVSSLRTNIPLLNLNEFSVKVDISNTEIAYIEFSTDLGAPSISRVDVKGDNLTISKLYTDVNAKTLTITAKDSSGVTLYSKSFSLPSSNIASFGALAETTSGIYVKGVLEGQLKFYSTDYLAGLSVAERSAILDEIEGNEGFVVLAGDFWSWEDFLAGADPITQEEGAEEYDLPTVVYNVGEESYFDFLTGEDLPTVINISIDEIEPVLEGHTFTVNATIDGSEITEVTFEFNGETVVVEGNDGVYSHEFTAPEVDEDTVFDINVTAENIVDFTESSEAQVNVLMVPVVPTVELGIPESVDEETDFTAAATVVDPDGIVDDVVFSFNGENKSGNPVTFTAPHLIGADEELPVTVTLVLNPEMSWRIGDPTIYDEDTILVNDLPADPVIEAVELPAEADEGTIFIVRATITDEDSDFSVVFVGPKGETVNPAYIGHGVYEGSFEAPEVDEDATFTVKVKAIDEVTTNEVIEERNILVRNLLPDAVAIKYLKISGTDVMDVFGGNEDVDFDFDLVNANIEDVEVERIITYYDGSFISRAPLTETGVHTVSYDPDIGSGMPGGRYDITVVATDSYGRSDSETVSFYVNVSPVDIEDAKIVSGMNGFGILAGDTATVEATVVADGYIRIDTFADIDDWWGTTIPIDKGLAIDGPISFRFDAPGEHKVTFEISLEGLEEGWHELTAIADTKVENANWWWEEHEEIGTVGYDPNPPEILDFYIVPKDCENDCFTLVAVVHELINYNQAWDNSDDAYWMLETLNATPFEDIAFTIDGVPVEYETITSTNNVTFTITSTPVCEEFASGYGGISDVHFEITNIKHKTSAIDTAYAFDFENGPVNIYFDHDNPVVDLDHVNGVPFCIVQDLHAYNFKVTLEDDIDLVVAQLVSPELRNYVESFGLAEVTDDLEGIELFDLIPFFGDNDTSFEFSGTFKINEDATNTEIYAERDIPITVVSTDTFCNTSSATTLMKIDLWNPRIKNVVLDDTCNTYKLGNEGFITYEATKLVMTFKVEDLHLLPDDTVIALYYSEEPLWLYPDESEYETYIYTVDDEDRTGYTYTATFTLPELDENFDFYAYIEAYDCCGHETVYENGEYYSAGDHTPPEIDLEVSGYSRTETWADVLDYLGWDSDDVVVPISESDIWVSESDIWDGYYGDFLSSIATNVTAYWFCEPYHFTITGNYTDNGVLMFVGNYPYWVDADGDVYDGEWVVDWVNTITPVTPEATAQVTFDATYVDGIEGVGLAVGVALDWATAQKDPYDFEEGEEGLGTFAWSLIPIIVDTATPTIIEASSDYAVGACGYDDATKTTFIFDIQDLFFDPENIAVNTTYGSFEFEAERDSADVDLWHITAVWAHEGLDAETIEATITFHDLCGHSVTYYTGNMKFDNVAPTLDSLDFFTTGSCPDCGISVNSINGGMAEVLAVLHDNNGIDDSNSDIELTPVSSYTVDSETVLYTSGATGLTYGATVTFDPNIEDVFTLTATITDFCGNERVITKTICVDTKDPVPLNWTFNPATNIVKVDFDEDVVVTENATAQLYVWLLDGTADPTDTDFEDYTKWQKKADYDASSISEYAETLVENDVAVAADSGTPYYNLQEGVWYGMILSGITDKCGNPVTIRFFGKSFSHSPRF